MEKNGPILQCLFTVEWRVMSSAINSSRPLQARHGCKGVWLFAMVNNKQNAVKLFIACVMMQCVCKVSVKYVSKFFSVEISMIEMSMTSTI